MRRVRVPGGSRRAATLVVAAAIGLGGCAAQPVDLSADAAARLQEAVWSVTSAAAQGRHDAAASALARVRSELDLAVEDGGISVQRYRQVDEALRAAEAELAALREASATAPDAATPDDDGAADEAAEPAPADPAPADPAPAQPGSDTLAPVVPVAPAPPVEEPSGSGKDAEPGNQGNGVGPDGNRGRGGGQGSSGNGQGRSPGQGRGPVGRE